MVHYFLLLDCRSYCCPIHLCLAIGNLLELAPSATCTDAPMGYPYAINRELRRARTTRVASKRNCERYTSRSRPLALRNNAITRAKARAVKSTRNELLSACKTDGREARARKNVSGSQGTRVLALVNADMARYLNPSCFARLYGQLYDTSFVSVAFRGNARRRRSQSA